MRHLFVCFLFLFIFLQALPTTTSSPVDDTRIHLDEQSKVLYDLVERNSQSLKDALMTEMHQLLSQVVSETGPLSNNVQRRRRTHVKASLEEEKDSETRAEQLQNLVRFK